MTAFWKGQVTWILSSETRYHNTCPECCHPKPKREDYRSSRIHPTSKKFIIFIVDDQWLHANAPLDLSSSTDVHCSCRDIGSHWALVGHHLITRDFIALSCQSSCSTQRRLRASHQVALACTALLHKRLKGGAVGGTMQNRNVRWQSAVFHCVSSLQLQYSWAPPSFWQGITLWSSLILVRKLKPFCTSVSPLRIGKSNNEHRVWKGLTPIQSFWYSIQSGFPATQVQVLHSLVKSHYST